MIKRFTFAAILLLVATQAWAFGEIRYADRPLNVRKARNLESEHVKTLQAGEKVRVDHLRDGWYAVFDLNASDPDESKAFGYAKSSFLLPVTPEAAPAPAAKVQIPAPPTKTQVPVGVGTAQPAPAETKIPVGVPMPEIKASAQSAPIAAPTVETKPLPVSSIIPSEIKAAAIKVSVRTARAVNSPISATLAPGQRVQAAFLRDGWFAVFKLDDKNLEESKALGFVHASELLPETPGVKPLAQLSTPAASSKSTTPEPTAPVASRSEITEAVQPVPVVPGETPSATTEAQTPVKITADRMTYVEKDRKVTFSGNVQAEHEGLQLWATTLSAYFTEAGKGAKDVADNIERIVADGGVKMKKEKSEGTCQTLIYFVKDGVLRMEGNPRLNDGANSVAGEVIKFYVKDNRSEVLGGQNKRVEAIFRVPEGAKKP
ncbi:MAG TPA: LptA/OstA family protein [Desulfovibrio sp.]|jgi:lipopolysaccharide export system protein LptA|uniref:LptA/OstA family protein n=1 Tax=Desulfovibrio TaxID=872 RepID=UPI002C029293|nr:LptA/OstA family protein [Desulfovibrio sp.]HMM38180.1 LptA/OstA family protein [Desulfovibrio sp.]